MEGYKNLSSYILATVLSDLNVEFVAKYINPKSRTRDQMEQAGRSGKQNIAEGYTMQSLESYIKLLGVAHGSFKELCADYEDFLRQKNLSIWPKDDMRVRDFRAVWLKPNIPKIPNLPKSPEDGANMLLTFCQMETFLLKRQIDALEKKFIEKRGISGKPFQEENGV